MQRNIRLLSRLLQVCDLISFGNDVTSNMCAFFIYMKARLPCFYDFLNVDICAVTDLFRDYSYSHVNNHREGFVSAS